MKKITRILLAMIMITVMSFSFISLAFAENQVDESIPTEQDESIPTEQNESISVEQSEEMIDSEVTSEPANSDSTDDMDDSISEDTISSDSASAATGQTITLQAPNQTLKVGETFGTTYSTSSGNLIVAYDFVLLDKNGNITDGKEAGTYTITIQNVRVYDASDSTFSTNLAGNYNIYTTNGTLTRTSTGTSGTSTSSTSTSTTGTTSSTTSVKTGDENNIGLWVVLSVVALAGVTTSVVLVRRKSSK